MIISELYNISSLIENGWEPYLKPRLIRTNNDNGYILGVYPLERYWDGELPIRTAQSAMNMTMADFDNLVGDHSVCYRVAEFPKVGELCEFFYWKHENGEYRGQGILVGYSAEKIYSGEHFPTAVLMVLPPEGYEHHGVHYAIVHPEYRFNEKLKRYRLEGLLYWYRNTCTPRYTDGTKWYQVQQAEGYHEQRQ